MAEEEVLREGEVEDVASVSKKNQGDDQVGQEHHGQQTYMKPEKESPSMVMHDNPLYAPKKKQPMPVGTSSEPPTQLSHAT